jgi:hypothetical protein
MSHRKPLSMAQANRLLFKITSPDIDYEATKTDIEDLVEFMTNLVEQMQPIFEMLGESLMDAMAAVQREFKWFTDLSDEEQAAVLKDIKTARGRAAFDAHSRKISLGMVNPPSASPLIGNLHATIFSNTTPEHTLPAEKLAEKMRQQGW